MTAACLRLKEQCCAFSRHGTGVHRLKAAWTELPEGVHSKHAKFDYMFKIRESNGGVALIMAELYAAKREEKEEALGKSKASSSSPEAQGGWRAGRLVELHGSSGGSSSG